MRSTLRESWIKEARKKRYTVYFLLGIEDNLEELVKQEAAEHEDIILTDIQERYENLHLKTFVSLLWKDKYCPQTTWLLKLDVDTEVFVENLNRLLNLKAGMDNAIFGHLVEDPVIDRTSDKKWFISFEAYSYKHFPNYVSGGAYLMSSDVPRKLIAAHMLCSFPYITVEDVYFTGILAEAVKVRRVHITEAYLFRRELPLSSTTWSVSLKYDVANMAALTYQMTPCCCVLDYIISGDVHGARMRAF
uniref:Hexosyltransferase n=1 Tax=Plectus sambesii TaxID=2011161 RepID=A0A914UY87_9BILA